MLSRCTDTAVFQKNIQLTRVISSMHIAEHHQLAERSDNRSRKADALFLERTTPPTK